MLKGKLTESWVDTFKNILEQQKKKKNRYEKEKKKYATLIFYDIVKAFLCFSCGEKKIYKNNNK